MATGETELDWLRVASYDPDADSELAAEDAARYATSLGASAEAVAAAVEAASAAAAARRTAAVPVETVGQRVSAGRPFGSASEPLEPAVWAETLAAAAANASSASASSAAQSENGDGNSESGDANGERIVVAPSGVSPLTIAFDVRRGALPPSAMVPNRVDALLGDLILGLRPRDPDAADASAASVAAAGQDAAASESNLIFWARYPAVRVLNFIEFQGARDGVLGHKHVYVPAEMAADTDLPFLIKGAWIW